MFNEPNFHSESELLAADRIIHRLEKQVEELEASQLPAIQHNHYFITIRQKDDDISQQFVITAPDRGVAYQAVIDYLQPFDHYNRSSCMIQQLQPVQVSDNLRLLHLPPSND